MIIWMKDSLKKGWYIDSGCFKHMTGDASKFTHISPKNNGHVTYGDNNKGKILGIWKIGVNVWIHDFDDDKEESNMVASKDKHCFKINTRLLQQTKPCFKINSRSSLASKQSVSKTSKALVIDYQAV